MHTPPLLLLRFFRWFCHPDYREDIEGDLVERFDKRAHSQGIRKARWLFIRDVLLLFRPGIIASIEGTQKLNLYGMFKHNLIISFRNFGRYKSSFIINLAGLSTGLACTLLIYLWIQDELSFDTFHEKGDRTYLVMQNLPFENGLQTKTGTSGLLADALEEEVPEVDQAIRTSDWIETFNVSHGKKRLKAQCMMADKNFFETFSYKLLQGDKKQVLQPKNAMVISSTLALSMFNSVEEAIGQRLDWESQGLGGEVIVSGVFDDTFLNSSDKFDFILPYEAYEEIVTYRTWNNNYARTYITLEPEASPDTVDEKIRDFLKGKDENANGVLFLKPYTERYLYNTYEDGKQTGGRIIYVRSFAAIGVFILLIACINFMNLATARSSLRTKEVGVKKVLGAQKSNLIFQYLTESVLLSFFSLLIALAVVALLLPQFNQLTGKELVFNFDKEMIGVILALCAVTGVFAGSYPAFYLSNFTPASVLRKKLPRTLSELWIRKGLVVFQFTLSVILIIGVLVVYKQIQFIQTKNLGYDEENVIRLEKDGEVFKNHEVFLAETRKIPGVVNAGPSNLTIGLGNYTYGVRWEGGNSGSLEFREVKSGHDLIETLGLEVVSGRAFSRDFSNEIDKIIFNETAIKKMGIKDPIGKTVQHYTGPKQIIGVVKDFYFESFHSDLKPLLFRFNPEETWYLFVRLGKGKEHQALTALEDLYAEFNPGFPFNYHFLDSDYDNLYHSEQQVATLSRYFAGVAILISCLGLLGLATFSAERRAKEIGIRKVLGSGTLGIVYLLTIDFTKMVVIGVLLAFPVSYYLIDSWLENFAYRITIEPWYFLLAGLLALMITWLTVGLQTFKAATVSPVQYLKNE